MPASNVPLLKNGHLPVTGGSPHFVDDDRMKQAHRSLYRSFLLLGIGSVLPTFVIFGAVDYFNDIGGGGDINFALNVCYNGCLFVCSVANALWLQKYGFTIRIVWGFVAMGVCMLSIPLLDQLREFGPSWGKVFESLVLILACILGIADAFAQGSLYGLTAAAFPPIYTQALMFGVAICGTLMSLARIACKLLYDDLRGSSYIFFFIAGAYSLSVAALYCRERRHNLLFLSKLDDAMETSPTLAMRKYMTSPKGTVLKPDKSMSFGGQVYELLVDTPAVRSACLMLIAANAAQYAVVPSILGLSHDFVGEGWSQVLAILACNVGNLFGRGPLATRYPVPHRHVWPSIGATCVLTAAVCLCVRPFPLSFNPFLPSALAFALGGASGYIATCIISTASTRVTDKDKETTGYLCILAIFFGLIFGSALAYPLRILVTGTSFNEDPDVNPHGFGPLPGGASG